MKRVFVPSQQVEEVPLTIDPTRPGCVAGRAVCTRPVIAVLTAGCVHEHIRRGYVCEHHLSKRLTCRACEIAGKPHFRCFVHPLKTETAALNGGLEAAHV